jgi:type II secretory pathway component GspD/PulD (secretin)
VAALVVASGCAASRAFNQGERAARAGDWDTAVSYYSQAVQKEPTSAAYKIALERAQLTASRAHLAKARDAEEKADLDDAAREYRKAVEFDPTNRRAAAKAVELEQKIRDKIESARPKPQIEQLKERARQTSPEPLLNPASRQPLKIDFAQGIQLKQILDFIGQTSGINVMYESTYQDQTTKSATDLEGVTLEQALSLVLTANNLFYKILNQKTILIIPDTPANRQKYEDQVIRTFYLSHADATEMLTMLNGILIGQGVQQSRPAIQINKSANSITIRASASMVAIAEQIVERNDKPRAEVVVDIEILEVDRTRVKQYGLNLSNYQIGVQFSPEGPPASTSTGTPTTTTTTATTGGSTFNLNTIMHGFSTSDFFLSVPSAVVKFLETDSQTKLIAKPSLRGAEGTKLTANLGDEIPVPSTTFSPLVQGGTGISPMTSFNYRSVGVNLEVTPRVTYDGDVIVDLMVESSTRESDVNVAGTNLPAFGSRKVTSRMRLRDGESNLLAGLLRDDERKSLTGFPGGIHVPVIQQLFSYNDNEIAQTDIVMLLTPHIIRTQGLTEKDFQGIYIGTSQNPAIGGAPPLIAPSGTEAAPASAAPPVTSLPYGAPGSALVGGAPVANPTPQGTPIIPPGSTPIPGTVMAPPPQAPAVPAPAPVQPAVTPAPAAPVPAGQPAPTPPPAGSAVAPPVVGVNTAQVLITPAQPEFRIGQGPYTVTISVANVTRVSTFSLTLTYNPAIVKMRSLQEGSFMRQGGVSAAFAHQEDTAAGRLDLAVSRAGDTIGATGSGTIAAVVFEPVAPGSVSFRSSGVASGPGGPITLQFAPATVTVR